MWVFHTCLLPPGLPCLQKMDELSQQVADLQEQRKEKQAHQNRLKQQIAQVDNEIKATHKKCVVGWGWLPPFQLPSWLGPGFPCLLRGTHLLLIECAISVLADGARRAGIPPCAPS